jgi:hypothetical protein
MTRRLFAMTVLAVMVPVAAQAYIGPGLGAGALAAALGVVGSVVLGIFAVLYYPIKRLLRRRKGASADKTAHGD